MGDNKQSRKDYMKAYYEKNKERWKQDGKWKNNWTPPAGYHLNYDQTLKGKFTRVRFQAKKRGIEFTIQLEDLVMPEFCPVLGVRLEWRKEVGKAIANPNSPSVDRIDNSKGYVPGNVRIISYRANSLKSDMTKEEARLLYENFERV